MKLIDLTGQTFGDRVVLRRDLEAGRHTRWICQCKCGRVVSVDAGNLRGKTIIACRSCASRRHGMVTSGEYTSWGAMLQRCENPRNKHFKNYGGRGITVCSAWHKFDQFFADMGPKPTVNHSIERDDNNGNYEPGNCTWATWREQCNNQRRSRKLEFEGTSRTVAEWATHLGQSVKMIDSRLRAGWPIDRVLMQPRRSRRSKSQAQYGVAITVVRGRGR